MEVLIVKRMSAHAILPRRATPGSAGYDLASVEDKVVPARGKVLISTGWAMTVPHGYYGRIAPRSGLALKNHIDVGAGVCDEDFLGVVGVVLFNHGSEDFHVKIGDRIAQFIITKITTPEVLEVDKLEKTERGEGGFGSTGRESKK
jgi:dUTP pyrophosphatase